MGKISLSVAAGVVALFGFLGRATDLFKAKPVPVADRAAAEQQLRKDGALKADGTVSVDKELDAEFNAITRELKSIEAQSNTELGQLEKEQ